MCTSPWIGQTSWRIPCFNNNMVSRNTGRPRFGSVRIPFRDGTVQAVPVFGSGGSSAKSFFFLYFSTV